MGYFVLYAQLVAFYQELDSYPVNLFWGDTHVHTYLSSMFCNWNNNNLDQAYRFAKAKVKANGGQYASATNTSRFYNDC